ncbi:hypothetical protein ACIP6I_02300 [Streptomyces anulatus]
MNSFAFPVPSMFPMRRNMWRVALNSSLMTRCSTHSERSYATKRPEVDELKAEVIRLRKELRDLRREKAGEVRDLKATATTYANQIQVLALRDAELEGEAATLRSQIADATSGTVRLLRKP